MRVYFYIGRNEALKSCFSSKIWKIERSRRSVQVWWGARTCRMIAHIEWAWLKRLTLARLYRYELPSKGFETIDDAGMWVSRTPAAPLRIDVIDDLPGALRDRGVELRVMERLAPLPVDDAHLSNVPCQMTSCDEASDSALNGRSAMPI